MDIKGKTVIVAGATSGLGLAVAHCFAGRGANVVLVGRRGELAAKLANETGDTALGVGADTTKPDHVAAAIDAAVERFGTIDISPACDHGGGRRHRNDDNTRAATGFSQVGIGQLA
jgi:3-hydroxyacyl-CoA dehydrogenase/3-hydroxy-2-methylbutyryl-CoA dehydrogenase